MKKTNQLLNTYIPPIVWALLIFLLSSQSVLPGFNETTYDLIFKKLAHVFVYFVLYLLIKRALDLTLENKSSKKHLYLPILISLIYALSDEFHQSFVPGRYPSLKDVGFDMVGVGIAFLRKYDFI